MAESKTVQTMLEASREYSDAEKELKKSLDTYQQKKEALKQMEITVPDDSLEQLAEETLNEDILPFEEFVKQDPDFAYIIKKDTNPSNGKEMPSTLFLKPIDNGQTIGLKLYRSGLFQFGGILTKEGQTNFTTGWHYYSSICPKWFQEKLDLVIKYQKQLKKK